MTTNTEELKKYEAVAHMFPRDLERFELTETFSNAYSVAVANPEEKTVPLYSQAQMLDVISRLTSLLASAELAVSRMKDTGDSVSINALEKAINGVKG